MEERGNREMGRRRELEERERDQIPHAATKNRITKD